MSYGKDEMDIDVVEMQVVNHAAVRIELWNHSNETLHKQRGKQLGGGTAKLTVCQLPDTLSES